MAAFVEKNADRTQRICIPDDGNDDTGTHFGTGDVTHSAVGKKRPAGSAERATKAAKRQKEGAFDIVIVKQR